MRRALTTLLSAALLGTALAPAPAVAVTQQQIKAEQAACERRKPPRKSAGTITESAYRKLERVIEAIAKGEYKESEEDLKKLFDGARSGYEKAIILQTLGFVYASQSQNKAAIKTFKDALALEALPQQPHEQMLFNVAQLYVADEDWDRGIATLNDYMKESCNPLPDAHILLASVYAERKNFPKALEQVDYAIAKVPVPKESWLQLKLALHYEQKQMRDAAETLVDLVALVPDKEVYWKQLSGILFEIKKDPEALAALAIAERKGYIDEEREYRQLASLYMLLEIPLKAGELMERGLAEKVVEPTEKNLSLAADAWLMAREYDKAEVAMKRAAQAADKGELWKRLGQIYIEKEEWKAAADALQRAKSKGGIKKAGEVDFLIGVAGVQMEDWKLAEEALRSAMLDEDTAEAAGQWLTLIEQEREYRELLAEQAAKDEEDEGADDGAN